MTARRPPAILTASDFHALRETRLVDKKGLVANIEAAFRKALGAAALSDDAIVEATLDRGEQTPFERAGLDVVRMCVAFREAPASDADTWLDRIGLALGKFEPIFEKRERQRKYGLASAAKRKPQDRRPEVFKLIRQALRRGENPSEYIADWRDNYSVPRSTLYRWINEVKSE